MNEHPLLSNTFSQPTKHVLFREGQEVTSCATSVALTNTYTSSSPVAQ